jgi:ABC-type Mn2+/Zn2+ transport system permease subunit
MLFSSLENLFGNITEGFVYRPILAAILIGIMCSVVGVYIILRKMVFLVDGIAHTAFAGGALGLLLVVNPYITIGLFGTSTAVLMGYFSEKGKLSNDTAVGILFSFAMALGIVFIGLMRSFTTSIAGLLFGSITTVSQSDLFISIVIAIISFLFMFFVKKELDFITFDEHLSKANGMPVRFINYSFLIVMSLVIMVSIRVIGIILLLAMIVTPAATAYQFAYRINRMIQYSIFISILGVIFGYLTAYILEISTSAAIVGYYTLFFVISLIISPKKKREIIKNGDLYCKQCADAIAQGVHCEYCEEEMEKEAKPKKLIQHHNHYHDEEGHIHE